MAHTKAFIICRVSSFIRAENDNALVALGIPRNPLQPPCEPLASPLHDTVHPRRTDHRFEVWARIKQSAVGVEPEQSGDRASIT